MFTQSDNQKTSYVLIFFLLLNFRMNVTCSETIVTYNIQFQLLLLLVVVVVLITINNAYSELTQAELSELLETTQVV